MERSAVLSTPLQPYRVLDLTDERGYLCGRLLADLGADVIKVEPPGGDAARSQGPFYGGLPHRERSLSWRAFNANKRSITLDITLPEGRGLLRELVKGASFLVESFDPGYLASLELDYGSLRALHPELVMVSITGFGQEGPYASYQAPDLVLQAMGGFMYVTGYLDGLPIRVGYPNAYLHAGSEGALAALMAHHHRVITGEGQYVDVSAQESVVWTLMDATPTWDINRRNVKRAGTIYDEPMPPMKRRNHWPCKDGQVSYVNYGGPLFAKSSLRLYRRIQEADGVDTSHLQSKSWLNTPTRTMTQRDLDEEAQVLGPFFLRRTKAELYQWALAERIMLTPVTTPREVLESPQLKARGQMIQVDYLEDEHLVPYPGAPAVMSQTPCSVRRRPPTIGEHNEEIYLGEMGLSREELVGLRARGVV